MPDDPFELWLGRLGNDRPFAHRMRGAVNRAGGTVARKASSFTGVRIGRGSGVGRILASRGGWTGRRVVVKARIVKLGGKGQAPRSPICAISNAMAPRARASAACSMGGPMRPSMARSFSNAAAVIATSFASSSRPRMAPNMRI